ncbi:glycosyltransferase family 2 protein [[Clostridium] scindens]|uniref:glycosyltransferase family 2 protein n=1 Tax=Clostridium scindens (strain JCM 10418 / VPI 12708) TaxID=29347 RepID=UPI0022DEEB5C|nr:glycosyltransferase family 2 protein [[Clostridium] scindens]
MLFAENEQKVFAFPKLVQEASGKVSICDVKKEGNQVVLVDDGSGEDKQQEFWKLSEYAIVLHHEQNRGKGAAIKTALKFIQESLWDYDVVGIMDGDGQHQVQDMEKLILKARSCGKSLILGTRQISEKMPLRSRFGNTITRNIFRLMTGTAVSDTQSGLRAFSSELNREFCEVSGERYEYETEVLLYCVKQKIPIVEVPIETIYRDKENSTSHFRVIRDSFRIYKEFIKE